MTLLPAYEAQLWLVHRRPDGTETMQQQTLRFGGAAIAMNAGSYTFTPVQVSTGKGTVTVDVTGKLQIIVGDQPDPVTTNARQLVIVKNLKAGQVDGKERILLSIGRRAHAATPQYLDSTGSSTVLIDVPKADDVLSFEFPPLQKATEDLLNGHKFSLRVKVTAIGR